MRSFLRRSFCRTDGHWPPATKPPLPKGGVARACEGRGDTRSSGNVVAAPPMRINAGLFVGGGVLDDPNSAQRCHPEEAKPTKDHASGGSKRSRLPRQNRPGTVGILRLREAMTGGDLIRHPPRGRSADATFPVRGEGFATPCSIGTTAFHFQILKTKNAQGAGKTAVFPAPCRFKTFRQIYS